MECMSEGLTRIMNKGQKDSMTMLEFQGVLNEGPGVQPLRSCC
ncbi:hypothetical protein DSTSK_31840 [Desulforhabdus sp. TSK]|nr:hypothetical protein DSTSK_31840 [Desulforhabdus sp. TSK]